MIILENYIYESSEANGTLGHTDQDNNKKLDDLIRESGLSEYCYKIKKPSSLWPTVGELRKNNKRLLLFNKYETKYANNYKKNFSITHWEINLYQEIEQGKCKLYHNKPGSQGLYVGNSYEQSIPITSVGGKILEALKKIGINPVIKGHIIGATDFKKINSKEIIKKRIAACEKANNKTATLLGLDMVEVGQGYEAVKEINMKRIEEFNKKTQ